MSIDENSNAYAQQNCKPTRVALLSGQYAPRNGVYNVGSLRRPMLEGEGRTAIMPPDQRENLNPESLSPAEFLRAAGYRKGYLALQERDGTWRGDGTPVNYPE